MSPSVTVGWIDLWTGVPGMWTGGLESCSRVDVTISSTHPQWVIALTILFYLFFVCVLITFTRSYCDYASLFVYLFVMLVVLSRNEKVRFS